MVIASNNASRGNDVPLSIRNRQDIARFARLASLVGHPVAALLGKRVAAIQIELGRVHVVLDHLNALLPDPFQTAIRAPFAKVVAHRIPTDFFFSGS